MMFSVLSFSVCDQDLDRISALLIWFGYILINSADMARRSMKG
jgi:hypothetical protein